MTAKDHNKLLSIFFFINAGLQVFGGIIVFVMYGLIGGAMISNGRDEEAQVVGGIMIGAAFVIGFIILIIAGFFIFTGMKLRKEQNIGKILGIIASILCLFSFPLGTALGVYGLWFFLGDKGKELYDGRGNMTAYHQPPPPNMWQ